MAELTYHQRYYLSHKAKYNAQGESWRKQNRERYNALQRRWRKEHPEAVKQHIAKSKEWRKSNPDKVRAMKRKHYLIYRDSIRAKSSIYAKWRRAIPEVRERERALAKIWVKNNPEKVAAKARRWRKRHMDQARIYALNSTHKRRAIIRGNTQNPVSIVSFVKGVKAKPFSVCYYCQRRVSTKHIHFDHIIPLSKGGAHSVENLCVSCPKCNCQKHNSLIEDWAIVGQQILTL